MKTKAKYEVIQEYLKNKIKTGEFQPGDKIETADELCKRFNVSYLTVNKALNNLTQEGFIERIQGSGTFVKSNAPIDMMSFVHYSSLSEDIRRIGKNPGSKLIKYEMISAGEVPDLAHMFGLNDQDQLHSFSRVRFADDVPIAISYSYISEKLVPVLDLNALDGGSLMQYLHDIGFPGTYVAYRKLYARMPSRQQQELLKIDANTPLLLCRHVSITEDQEVYNYVDTYYVSDRYEFTLLSFPQDVTNESCMFDQLPDLIQNIKEHN